MYLCWFHSFRSLTLQRTSQPGAEHAWHFDFSWENFFSLYRASGRVKLSYWSVGGVFLSFHEECFSRVLALCKLSTIPHMGFKPMTLDIKAKFQAPSVLPSPQPLQLSLYYSFCFLFFLDSPFFVSLAMVWTSFGYWWHLIKHFRYLELMT